MFPPASNTVSTNVVVAKIGLVDLRQLELPRAVGLESVVTDYWRDFVLHHRGRMQPGLSAQRQQGTQNRFDRRDDVVKTEDRAYDTIR